MTVKVTKPALNLREELSSLKKPSGVAGEAMLRAETPQEQFNLIGAGRKNLIINGNFQVSQRGDFTSATSVSHVTYYLDRWDMLLDGTTATIQDTGLAVKVAATSSTSLGRLGIRQKIEDHDWLDGKTVTLSAKMKSNNPNARLFIYDALGRSSSEAVASNEEWVDVYVTRTISNFSGVTIYARIASSTDGDVAVSSGDYIELKDVQLELGSVSTPFEHRSYGEELALCQRYYQRLHGETANGGRLVGVSNQVANGIFGYDFPIKMRATPAMYFYGGSGVLNASFSVALGNGNLSSANVTSYVASTDGFRFNVSTLANTNTPCWIDLGVGATYYLSFGADAEL